MSGNVPDNAGDERPRFWKSGTQWIECDWNNQLQRYECKEVDASEVPASQGGTGPG
jgi:hypothetical protein